jgi:hypothetical protein
MKIDDLIRDSAGPTASDSSAIQNCTAVSTSAQPELAAGAHLVFVHSCLASLVSI